MKTKRKVIEVTNGFKWWIFHAGTQASVGAALMDGNVQRLYELCIYEEDCETGVCTFTIWPNLVRTRQAVYSHVKDDRVKAERNL